MEGDRLRVLHRNEGALSDVWKGFRNGLGRFKEWHPAAHRPLGFLAEVLTRYLRTRNPHVMDDEVCMSLAGKTSEHVSKPKVDLVAAEGIPAASVTAQALRQGEEASDNRRAAATAQGVEFSKQSISHAHAVFF